MKKICDACNGNGFIRVPYEEAREEIHAQCKVCNSQGEIEEDDHDPKQTVEDLKKQKALLQSACRRAGTEIQDLKATVNALENTIKQFLSPIRKDRLL
tara:strand:- start:5809 stop:6102 length:294 start_codon:yes stop_codon:yes gene_type:complete